MKTKNLIQASVFLLFSLFLNLNSRAQAYINDAALEYADSLVSPFSSGSKNIYVVLENYGSNALQNAKVVWSVNGVSQSNYNWSGNLLTDSMQIVNLGSYTFSEGIEYIIQAYVTDPNGTIDEDNWNDTTMSYPLYAALNGEYSVGNTSSDFTSLSEAIEALNNGGMLARVSLNLQDGTYNEQISISEVIGLSEENTLTIQSESGVNTDVTITYTSTGSSDNYVIELDGADYVTLKNISLKNTGTTYSSVIAVGGQRLIIL